MKNYAERREAWLCAGVEIGAKVAEAEKRAESQRCTAVMAQTELEKVRKELALASPEMAMFKLRFEALQAAAASALDALERVRVSDAAAGEKCAQAVLAVLERAKAGVEEGMNDDKEN